MLQTLADRERAAGAHPRLAAAAEFEPTYADAPVGEIKPDTGRVHTSYPQCIDRPGTWILERNCNQLRVKLNMPGMPSGLQQRRQKRSLASVSRWFGSSRC